MQCNYLHCLFPWSQQHTLLFCGRTSTWLDLPHKQSICVCVCVCPLIQVILVLISQQTSAVSFVVMTFLIPYGKTHWGINLKAVYSLTGFLLTKQYYGVCRFMCWLVVLLEICSLAICQSLKKEWSLLFLQGLWCRNILKSSFCCSIQLKESVLSHDNLQIEDFLKLNDSKCLLKPTLLF